MKKTIKRIKTAVSNYVVPKNKKRTYTLGDYTKIAEKRKQENLSLDYLNA